MKARNTFATIILGTLLLGGCATMQSNSSFKAGKTQANEDIANGILAIEQAGFLMKFDEEYVQLLKQKYGVEVRRVAFCVVHEDVEEHMRGYNKVAEAEIERRFGKGCLLKAEQQAQALYEARPRAH
jgi:hypothetical protein